MTPETLRSLSEEPENVNSLVKALWLDARGDWESAHQIVQEDPSTGAARVHAYLHRKEGDSGNAGYWYARAGCSPHPGSLETEWAELVIQLSS
jgi:hypothetical protein